MDFDVWFPPEAMKQPILKIYKMEIIKTQEVNLYIIILIYLIIIIKENGNRIFGSPSRWNYPIEKESENAENVENAQNAQNVENAESENAETKDNIIKENSK